MNKDGIIDDCRTTRLFWDCECKENFIKPQKVKRCHVCGAARKDQPDSRISEVRDFLKNHLTGGGDMNMQDNNLVIKAEDTPCEYMCKHCSKTIDYVLYTKHGKLPLLHGAISDRDPGELLFFCPECNEEVEYSELKNAGVL